MYRQWVPQEDVFLGRKLGSMGRQLRLHSGPKYFWHPESLLVFKDVC